MSRLKHKKSHPDSDGKTLIRFEPEHLRRTREGHQIIQPRKRCINTQQTTPGLRRQFSITQMDTPPGLSVGPEPADVYHDNNPSRVIGIRNSTLFLRIKTPCIKVKAIISDFCKLHRHAIESGNRTDETPEVKNRQVFRLHLHL